MTSAARARDEWPNLFVVGAAKAGTTSLWRYLNQHPDIFMSPVKEPHFFSSFTPGLFPAVKDEASYLRLFADAGDAPLRGEASASYLWDPETPEAIRRASPHAKIVISLRDPVERAYAFYWTGVKYGGMHESFLDAIRAELALPDAQRRETLFVGYSLYADSVRRYVDTFDGNVFVLFFEELNGDTRGELRRLFHFLGVDASVAEKTDIARHNRFALPRSELARRFLTSKRLRSLGRMIVPTSRRESVEGVFLVSPPRPEMDPEARRLLEAAFAPDRAVLQEILGRELPW